MKGRALVVVGLLLSACVDDQPEKVTVGAPPLMVTPVTPIKPPSKPVSATGLVEEKKVAPENPSSLPSVSVDLSLPQHLLEGMHFEDPQPMEQTESLLPPLFNEKPERAKRFQLNGRLFTNDQFDSSSPKLDGVDGGELQLQYKP